MSSTKITALALLLGLFLYACGNQDTSKKSADASAKTMDTLANAKPVSADTAITRILTAKFVEFSLGDAQHFVFEDKTGKRWDFGGNKDTKFAFAKELPAKQANESNQGWTSEKTLQGKWFDLKYVYVTQPEYLDGPMASVPVILEAKLKE